MKICAEKILEEKSIPIPEHPFDDLWIKDANGSYIAVKPEWHSYSLTQKALHPDIAHLDNVCFDTIRRHLEKEDEFSPEFWAAALLENLYQLLNARDNNEINNAIHYAIQAADLYSKLEHRFKQGALVESEHLRKKRTSKRASDKKRETEKVIENEYNKELEAGVKTGFTEIIASNLGIHKSTVSRHLPAIKAKKELHD